MSRLLARVYVEEEEAAMTGRAEVGREAVAEQNHYAARGGIPPIAFIESNGLGFSEGCIVKYLYRWPHKDGVRDLEKAAVYALPLYLREEQGLEPEAAMREAGRRVRRDAGDGPCREG